MTPESYSQLTDPRTAAVRRSVRCGRHAEISTAVAAARSGATRWAALTPKERAIRLTRLADLVEQHEEAFLVAERAGTGKPTAEAAQEFALSVELIRYYAWAVRTATGPAAGQFVAGHESWVRWEPLGVVAAIVPWNYPLLMLAWRCAPALAAGNAVVAKPAETTPDSAELLAGYAAEILGADVLHVVTGDRDTGRLLVESAVDAVAFTGSLAGGADVARRAGVRRVSLELGGNAPAVVLPDAPRETYAELAAAATYNAGQSCAAPARVITLWENYEEVVRGLAEAMAQRRAGRDFGPLNNADQADRYDRILKQSHGRVVDPADPVIASGEETGFWRPAVVLADVPGDDPAVVEEVFAPVLTVQPATDLTEAVRLANSQPQALAASVWSTGLDSALDVARDLNAGEAWVNCHLVQTAELPHGGRGASGHGTDLSTLALHEYQRPKTITVRLGQR
ncbi:aldehyde dehydrogenase family protein [Micromonospora sp. CPCC 206060]|uniref:aldehyde dehydrogenase family protein n=1 Tax=Micromonospora sp. CPCC 206060 TaxID=3122406 RepID=UPI002FEEC6C1